MKNEINAITAYKMVRKMKDGSYTPLFCGRSERYMAGQVYKSQDNTTNGFKSRQGFHCVPEPVAPHLKLNTKKEKRVWLKVKVSDFRIMSRFEHQGGNWILANSMKVIRELSPFEVQILGMESI